MTKSRKHTRKQQKGGVHIHNKAQRENIHMNKMTPKLKHIV